MNIQRVTHTTECMLCEQREESCYSQEIINLCINSAIEEEISEGFRKGDVSEAFCPKTCKDSTSQTKAKRNMAIMLGWGFGGNELLQRSGSGSIRLWQGCLG